MLNPNRTFKSAKYIKRVSTLKKGVQSLWPQPTKKKPVPANILQKRIITGLRAEAVTSLQSSNIPPSAKSYKLHKSVKLMPLIIGEL